MMDGLIMMDDAYVAKDIGAFRSVFETAVCAVGLRHELGCLSVTEEVKDGKTFAEVRFTWGDEEYVREYTCYDYGYDLKYCVRWFMEWLCRYVAEVPSLCGWDCTLDYKQREIVEDYLVDLPEDKVLVFETDSFEHKRLFLRYDPNYGRFMGEVLYFDAMEMGSGPRRSFNTPIRRANAMYLETGYDVVYDDNGMPHPAYISKLVSVGCYPKEWNENWGDMFISEKFSLIEYQEPMIFSFSNVTDVRLEDFHGRYLDAFATEYMLKANPEEVEDIDDDDGEIARAYDDCRAYNPEAFDYWEDYFCRKRCMIDGGAGCGSNCCKQRVVEFVEYQYISYGIKSAEDEAKEAVENES